VEYVAAQRSQSQEESVWEIFMELKMGNLDALIRKDIFTNNGGVAETLLKQMLQALDYLAHKGIVHRDVKPANILYTPLKAKAYNFQLADFGLCNFITEAKTYVGSPLFMAPEVVLGDQQTPKMDVWSLFVTLACAMNIANFREAPTGLAQQRHMAVEKAATSNILQPIKAMAIVNPDRRASAAEMLDQLFDGQGRSTARTEIAPKVKKIRKCITDRRPTAPRSLPCTASTLGKFSRPHHEQSQPRANTKKRTRQQSKYSFLSPGGRPSMARELPRQLAF